MGNFFLHVAASKGLLGLVPSEVLTMESMLKADGNNDNVYDYAVSGGMFSSLPETLLVEKALIETNGNFHIDGILHSNGNSVLHKAALKGKLDQIPEQFLTEKNLRIGNLEAQTVFHCAAIGGCLDQIPESVLTLDNLCRVDGYGQSVFIVAADHGVLTTLPVGLLNVN